MQECACGKSKQQLEDTISAEIVGCACLCQLQMGQFNKEAEPPLKQATNILTTLSPAIFQFESRF